LAEIRVLGTEFNVKSNIETLEIEVQEGIVEVKTITSNLYKKIAKGERCVYLKNELSIVIDKAKFQFKIWMESLKIDFKKLNKEIKIYTKKIEEESKEIENVLRNEFEKLKN